MQYLPTMVGKQTPVCVCMWGSNWTNLMETDERIYRINPFQESLQGCFYYSLYEQTLHTED